MGRLNYWNEIRTSTNNTWTIEKVLEMALMTDFKRASKEEWAAASFKPGVQRGEKTAKRPVGRPRKHPLQCDTQPAPESEKENVHVPNICGSEATG